MLDTFTYKAGTVGFREVIDATRPLNKQFLGYIRDVGENHWQAIRAGGRDVRGNFNSCLDAAEWLAEAA